VSEENEDPTRSFMTRAAYDKEQDWEDNKQKLEFPGYSYVRHTSNEYISGVRSASDGYAHSAMQINISDLKGAMGEGSEYDDTAIKRELEKQGKAIETNTDAIADKSDSDHTHSEIPDPYDDSWIQPEIDTKSDKGHTHDISHDHDTEYQPVGDYADKNHLHNFDHTHDDYLTSDDLPDPYDDAQIRDDFAAADQNLQDQITIINDAGYDDSGIKLSIALEEEARIAGDDSLSGRIDGKADDHNHNSQYQPIGDYATNTDLDGKSDTTHSHPPQDTTHDHDAEYAPIHEHPYSDKDHTHPPQDLTHNHDSDYQPVGDYATNKTVVDGDQDLQDQIDAISNSGGYNDSWIEPAINTGDANTLQGAKQYTDEEVGKISVPDISDLATKTELNAEATARTDGDALLKAQIDAIDEYDDTSLKGRVSTNEGNITALQTEQGTQDVAIKENKDAIDALVIPDVSNLATKTELDTKFDKGTTIYTDAKAMEDAIAKNVTDIEAISASGGYNDAWIQPAIDAEESSRIAGDETLQDQIDAISASGYDDRWVQPAIDAGDAKTLADANTYTDSKVYDGDALEASVAQNTKDISDLKTEQGTQDSLIQENADAIALLDNYDDTALRGLITVEEAARVAGDSDLASDIAKNTASIAAINANGSYDDTELRGLITDEEAERIAGDAGLRTDIDKNTASISEISIPDVSDFATTDYVDAGDAAVEAKIPDVSNFATNQELTDGLASKSDTTHDHDEFTHTHDFTHDHDGQYALEHDHPYAPTTHDHPHDHDATYATKTELTTETQERNAGDDALQDQIDAIQSSGYDDTQLRSDFAAADVTTLASANTYTNEEVAKVFVPDVSDFATKTEVADGDSTTLTTANTYTNEEIAKIPATDVSSLATKEELSTGLAGKSDDPHTHDTTHDHLGEYAGKAEFDAHHHDDDYLTSDDLPDPYDDSEVKGLITNEEGARVAGDESLQNQIDTINNSGYDDTALRGLIQGNTDALDDKSDTTHSHPPQDLTHTHDEFADKEHNHPPQDLTHTHDEFADKDHAHDLTHTHDEFADKNALEDHLANHPEAEGYDDTQVKADIQSNRDALEGKEDKGHTHPPQDLSHTHREYADKTEFDLHQHDTSHLHTEYSETRHNHDGTYAPTHNHPYAADDHSHPPQDLTHDHDGNPLPLPYPDANSLGNAVNGKADQHGHPYVKTDADTDIKPTADNRFVSFKNKRPKEEDGSYEDKEFGLEIDIDEGNTYKNQFIVGNRHGYALKVLGGGGKTTWFGGKITQKGDSLENPDDRDYIIRKNLTDAISELSDEYASEGHNHEEYFPFGDWSDSEFEPHADLRAWDDAWMEMFNFYDKAQKITDRIQDTRLDALEEQNVSLLSKIEELEGRIEELEPDYGIALGTFTLKVDNGRPTGASQTIGVAGIWHSKVADATTSPNNEMKANNGSSALINQITSHEGPIKLRIIQANGNKQTWACESSGWTTNTNVIHISSNGISGDDLNPDEEVQVFVELL